VRVEWHQLALEDRDIIVAYLELLNPNAASSVLRGLVLAGDSLALFPTRGRVGLATGTRHPGTGGGVAAVSDRV
jgi:plasmid stabilization system protein ParE